MVGTRKGDVYFVDGAFEEIPEPTYHLFASGQDEIFGERFVDPPPNGTVASNSKTMEVETIAKSFDGCFMQLINEQDGY